MAAQRPSRPPGREPLSADRIVSAALVRIDADGLDALSMRILGSDLGVKAMSLYNYFDTKELMLDAVVGELIATIRLPDRIEGDWRAQIRVIAMAFRDIATRHPNAFPLFVKRTLGAYVHGQALAERSIVTLVRAGFEEDTAIRAFRTIARYVVGAAMTDSASNAAEVSPDAEVSADAPLVNHAIHDLADTSTDELFEFGLDLILDGLAAHLPRA